MSRTHRETVRGHLAWDSDVLHPWHVNRPFRGGDMQAQCGVKRKRADLRTSRRQHRNDICMARSTRLYKEWKEHQIMIWVRGRGVHSDVF